MTVLRLIVQSEITYVLNVLSQAAGVTFDDRRVIDIPLRSEEQLRAGRFLEKKFAEDEFSSVLRNGSNAVCVYGATVIDL